MYLNLILENLYVDINYQLAIVTLAPLCDATWGLQIDLLSM